MVSTSSTSPRRRAASPASSCPASCRSHSTTCQRNSSRRVTAPATSLCLWPFRPSVCGSRCCPPFAFLTYFLFLPFSPRPVRTCQWRVLLVCHVRADRHYSLVHLLCPL